MKRTVFTTSFITLEDTHPKEGKVYSFTFPQRMEAYPLTIDGDDGSEPNNKAPWWPYFQKRHEGGAGLFWVQGHMLNHNIHGPGTPENLVPISNTLNSNMHALVEREVKSRVAAGKTLKYIVEAHWEAARTIYGNDPAAHPAKMREDFGIKEIDEDGKLLWGEQVEPTRLSWQLYEEDSTGTLVSVALSAGHYDPSQWMNNFPHS